MKRLRSIFWVVFYVLTRVWKNGLPDLAAALAYYFLLSIFPLLIFTVALLPYLNLDPDQAVAFVKSILPAEAAVTIDQPVRDLVERPRGGILSFGLLAALYVASNGVFAIIRALNTAYQVEETRPLWRLQLLSIAMTISIVLVFAVLLLLPVFGQVIFQYLDDVFGLPPEAWTTFLWLRWLAVFVLTNLVLIGIYQIAPNTSVAFRKVMVGALVASIGWQVISLGFSYYVSNFNNFSATYGSLGGVIVLMVWFYLTGLLLVLGGLVNATLHQQKHVRLE
ncbi:YihY/virulence factor BrkB family protein [Desmospora profundinema]|uniref:Membrane protein n=1 Tax=Desmospora profundinema TaxID=1571184 RepID=A0ABU1IS25_9BACL|nr:YihY/virulence factor BrkB family protein [Desmospora profundinema]MDR6227592.1 membrane protein [Desmospora profundinema]